MAVVAGVLHLCNVQFEATDNDGSRVSRESRSYDALALAARVLSVDVDQLEHNLCFQVLTIGHEEQNRTLNPDKASDSRDSLVKAIYSRSFDWIVGRVNIALAGQNGALDPANFIGILDIFGFEVRYPSLLLSYSSVFAFVFPFCLSSCHSSRPPRLSVKRSSDTPRILFFIPRTLRYSNTTRSSSCALTFATRSCSNTLIPTHSRARKKYIFQKGSTFHLLRTSLQDRGGPSSHWGGWCVDCHVFILSSFVLLTGVIFSCAIQVYR